MQVPDILKCAALAGGIGLLAATYYNYLSGSQIYAQVARAEVRTWNQIEPCVQKQEGRWVLLKDSFSANTFRTISQRGQFPIDSNMRLFDMLPLRSYRWQVFQFYNNYIAGQRYTTLTSYPDWIKLPFLIDRQLTPVTKIEYQSIFDAPDSPGIISTIFKYTLATLAGIAQGILKILKLSNKDTPMVEGPVWGKLTLYSTLLTNVPIVMLCQINDSKLVPSIAGLNKQEILQYLDVGRTQDLLTIAVSFFLIYKSRSVIYRVYERLKEQFGEWISRGSRPLKRQLDCQVEDDQLCIICYAKCRNVIFRNCRHLSLCNGCARSRSNVINSCPTCRVDIQGDYINVVHQE